LTAYLTVIAGGILFLYVLCVAVLILALVAPVAAILWLLDQMMGRE
jgi:hypothetical protein